MKNTSVIVLHINKNTVPSCAITHIVAEHATSPSPEFPDCVYITLFTNISLGPT